MGEATDLNEEQHQKPTDRLGRCVDLAREQKGDKGKHQGRIQNATN